MKRPSLFSIPKIHFSDIRRAFIGHSSRGLLRSTPLHHSMAELNVEALSMNAGDTIDFIVGLNEGLKSNQFLWSPKITPIAMAGSDGNLPSQPWEAEKDFSGPGVYLLRRWQQLAQVLMLANVFVFLD